MRRTLSLIPIVLGLMGGVAAADPERHDHDRDRRDDHHERYTYRERHYRDHYHRPVVRYERHDYRVGFRWEPGEWRWNGAEWIWSPGHYIRVRW